MKKVLVTMLLLAGLTAMAQKGEHGDHNGRERFQDLTPEQMATLQTKKMTLVLDLTEGQQEKIKAIELENANMRKTAREERKALKEAGDVKKPTSEERYAMANATLDRQIAHKADLKSILSEQQFTKWEKMQHHKAKHRKRNDNRHHGKRK